MKMWRTFQVVKEFTCVSAVLEGSSMHDPIQAAYEEGLRFTVEVISKPDADKVYCDHRTQTLFGEKRIAFLLKEEMIGEIVSGHSAKA